MDMILVKENQRLKPTLIFLLGLGLGNGLMLTPEGSLLRMVGGIILLMLPGLVWFYALGFTDKLLVYFTMGLGLSYTFIVVSGMLLHYLPGPIPTWSVWVLLNLASLAGLVWLNFISGYRDRGITFKRQASLWILLTILIYAALFYLVDLGYSEFDGDEIKVVMPAAEAIEGRAEALFFQRKKGPGEILIPMMVWRLTGLVNELNVRLPFALAGVMSVLTVYLVAQEMFGEKEGLIAAALLALNGYMMAFARIVQFPQMVVWMSLLVLWCAWFWRQTGQARWGGLAGIFLGVGFLNHYDIVLAVPALLFIFFANPKFVLKHYTGLSWCGFYFLVIIGLFWIPYVLTPQFEHTTVYLSGRIGSALFKNSLGVFLFHTIFYNSLYYVVIVGLLAFGHLAWAVAQWKGLRRLTGGPFILLLVAIVCLVELVRYPNGLSLLGVNLAFLPVALFFLVAFLSPAVNFAQRAAIAWFGAAFLGYSFLVEDPRNHFYALVPAWILVASLSATWLWNYLTNTFKTYLAVACAVVLVLLMSGYLYLVYLRHEPEFKTDWPRSQVALYWFPYQRPLRQDSIGMVHKEGWKALGGLYMSGRLVGDYQTNGLYEIADWYTRHQLRGCTGQAANFFVVSPRLVDRREFPQYLQAGEVELPNGKGITVYQKPPVSELENVDEPAMGELFDRTAWPAAFVRPTTLYSSTRINLAGFAELTSYEITIPQPRPGTQLMISLYWQTLKPPPLNADVFVHLEAANDPTRIWGQSNGTPACGKQPTSTWITGEAVEDPHLISIDPETPAGTYKLMAGMYLPEGNLRVPVLNETGHPAAEAIELTEIIIQ